jgi:hypothetical protein
MWRLSSGPFDHHSSAPLEAFFNEERISRSTAPPPPPPPPPAPPGARGFVSHAAAAAAAAVVKHKAAAKNVAWYDQSDVVGRYMYKLNPVDPQLEGTPGFKP